MERLDAVVIGGGVVGLAIGRELALSGRDVAILEAKGAFGSETSSRNSEVIHAGIYYAKDSLKARLCVEGKHRLYRYCSERAIEHRRCGKLIVAVGEAEAQGLPIIKAKAEANGVSDLEYISGNEARAIEPELSCSAALASPSTGIVDSHGLMLSLLGDMENAGGFLCLETPVIRVLRDTNSLVLETGGEQPMTVGAKLVVNAAGHWAPNLAKETSRFPKGLVPTPYYCKGRYYMLSGARPFGRLIYPMPQTHGLGVHATVDLAGSVRFGPDTVWVDEMDFEVEPEGADSFYEAVRRYYPALADGSLIPAYAGIRPKTGDASMPVQDFTILGPRDHGIGGHVALFGIESPGLTACLSIAAMVSDLLSAE